MDDHTFLRTQDGSIIRKGRKIRNWVALIFFGVVIIATVWVSVSGILRGTMPVGNGLMLIAIAAAICGFPTAYIVRLIKEPPIRFDAQSKTLNVVTDTGMLEIPFENVSCVVKRYDKSSGRRNKRRWYSVHVELDDSKVLSMGVMTVSGSRASAEKRASALAGWIANATGASIRQDYPEVRVTPAREQWASRLPGLIVGFLSSVGIVAALLVLITVALLADGGGAWLPYGIIAMIAAGVAFLWLASSWLIKKGYPRLSVGYLLIGSLGGGMGLTLVIFLALLLIN